MVFYKMWLEEAPQYKTRKPLQNGCLQGFLTSFKENSRQFENIFCFERKAFDDFFGVAYAIIVVNRHVIRR